MEQIGTEIFTGGWPLAQPRPTAEVVEGAPTKARRPFKVLGEIIIAKATIKP